MWQCLKTNVSPLVVPFLVTQNFCISAKWALFWKVVFCIESETTLIWQLLPKKDKTQLWLPVPSHFPYQTLPKAQRTRGLSSYHKFKHESWSNFILRISTSKSQPNIGLSIKLVQTYVASEYQPRFNFMTSTKHQQKKLQLQILPELQLQNLDQT